MKIKVWTSVLAALLAASLSIFSAVRGPGPAESFQVETPPSKPSENDYMNNLLSRDTNPLWLKENPVLRRYLAEPATKWAVRSARVHILH
ncbi:MAG: hypothetical protein R6V02_10480 [Candidatus Aminicenantes bacterium]